MIARIYSGEKKRYTDGSQSSFYVRPSKAQTEIACSADDVTEIVAKCETKRVGGLRTFTCRRARDAQVAGHPDHLLRRRAQYDAGRTRKERLAASTSLPGGLYFSVAVALLLFSSRHLLLRRLLPASCLSHVSGLSHSERPINALRSRQSGPANLRTARSAPAPVFTFFFLRAGLFFFCFYARSWLDGRHIV